MTRIVLAVQDPESGNSMTVEVEEAFDRVLDLRVPVQQPASALEARANVVLTKADDGLRVFVDPNAIATIEECP
jgi:hypothetical protein